MIFLMRISCSWMRHPDHIRIKLRVMLNIMCATIHIVYRIMRSHQCSRWALWIALDSTEVGFIGLPFSRMPTTSLPLVSSTKEQERPLPIGMRCPNSPFFSMRSLMFWVLISWVHFLFLMRLRPPKLMMLKFGVPKALISDQGSYFCNKTMSTLLEKCGVVHRVATSYHPQTNGRSREIKQILQKVVNLNRKDWNQLLDDAFRAHRTTYRTLLGMSTYQIVFQIEHYAYWVVKKCNLAFDQVGKERKLQLQELEQLRLEAYENSKIYKER
ncbi:pol, partial [Mucuna pruriens]